MLENHLKEGECAGLYRYCLATSMTLEDADDTLRAITQEDAEIFHLLQHLVDQQRADALSYQNVSSYGTSKEEIFRRARDHFIFCEPCKAQYAGEVLTNVALQVLSGFVKGGKIDEEIARWDFLKVGQIKRNTL